MLAQEIFSAVAFAFLVGLGCLSNYLTHHINVQVLSEEHEAFNPDSFIATRSYNDLKVLNDIGPKATGSDANEIHTVDFLMRRINQIKSDYANVSEIAVDLQVVSGTRPVSAHYKNLQNIVVKLQGKSDNALMINCHFDSEYGSSGVSDDGVNCCAMLELLRVMAKSGRKNEHSIIFLFNGSEEGSNLAGLHASHGFIMQHEWKSSIKAFVNLDAQGASGREMLFRSGPKHDWMVKKYRESVPNGFGQVFGEEMFETGILNSGTDFENFREFGNISGLDIAYAHLGWVYHTKFDNIRYVTIESIQNTGNNVLALIKALANSEELSDPPEGSAVVFYDVVGLFFISYTAAVGVVINIVVSILAVALPFLLQIKFKLANCSMVLTETLSSFANVIIGSLLSLVACFLLGLIINSTDNAMFWFNASVLSLGVYCSLAVLVQVGVYHLSSVLVGRCWRGGKDQQKHELRLRIQAHLNGVNLFWALLTIVVTSFGLRSGYLFMVMLMISLITNVLIYLVEWILPKTRLHTWVFVHFLGHTFSFLWTCYLSLVLFQVLVPIKEKTYDSNPELTIGLYCGLMSILTLSYFIPLTVLVKNRAIIYSTLIGTFVISMILAYSSAGFPYDGSLSDPRVQRHYIHHTRRTFYSDNGAVRYTDIGFFFREHERNTKREMEKFLDPNSFTLKEDDPMCETETFCGFPTYNVTRGFWMKASEPPTVPPSTLRRTSRLAVGDSLEMKFDLVGTFMNLLFVTPENGVQVSASSVGLTESRWREKVVHYMKLTHGKGDSQPFNFTLHLDISKMSSPSSTKVTITVVTIDSHFDRYEMAHEFKDLVAKFPDYTFVQTHQAEVGSYLFN